MSHVLASLVILLASASLGAGCSVFPWWASVNEPGGGNHTAASLAVDDDVTADRMFVGLAISGGGLRAANFGAAVMFELQELGLLEKVDFISSVSGGSLAAAYYGLDGYRAGSHSITFRRATVDEVFSRNLQSRWVARWFDPRNFLRYWVTAFDRSDIMVQVFDANLFHRATFGDLGRGLPARTKVLINAVNFVNGRKFVFSNEAFDDRLRSDLAGYPVSRAVMASGAFPGAFANVTLRDHRFGHAARYVHLFDGGPIDNLGAGSLIKLLQRYVAERYVSDPAPDPADLLRKYGFSKGCLIVAVDAYPAGVEERNTRSRAADTRPWYGFLVDTNFTEAFDDLLAVKRNELLHELGLDKEDEDVFGSFPLFGLDLDDDELGVPRRRILRKMTAASSAKRYDVEATLTRGAYCHVWHIAISQLPPAESCPLGKLVNGIRTEYRIGKREQCGLFEAARTLVQTAWQETGLGRLLQTGLPTNAPLPGAPINIPTPLDRLSCHQEPELVPADGRQACRLNAGG